MYSERRRSVRQKVNAPAFAIFDGVTGGMILDLSQEGMSMQRVGPGIGAQFEQQRPIKMRLDLPDPELLLETTGYIAWADALGRAGVRFSDLPEDAQRRLDEWLTINASVPTFKAPKIAVGPTDRAAEKRPLYLDNLAVTFEAEGTTASATSSPASSTVQYEFARLASDLNAALRLIADRARSLTRGSGAAIALSHKGSMICRASVGSCAPTLGSRLDSNSRFSHECLRTGRAIRCDDAQNHLWIDSDNARESRLRSILAAPVQYERDVVGLLAVFSTDPCAFDDGDLAVVDRLARTVLLTLCQDAEFVRSVNAPARGNP